MNPQSPHAKVWRLRTRQLSLQERPIWMGILNVTPDSFSDGGKYFDLQSAVDQALRLEDDGADILDLGGESTRPYSESIAVEDELRRIAPVMSALQGRIHIPLSIDTTKSRVAAAAIDLGAEIINDVSGLTADPEMICLAASTKVGVCAMHMQGTPQTMQDAPLYQNVVSEIVEYLRACDATLVQAGIAPDRICLDPGIGFGKTHEHNLELLREVSTFHQLGRPLLVGHSRKGFIAKLIDDKRADRDPGTIGVSLAMAIQGVQVLRVHNVAANRQAMTLFLQSISSASYFRD